MAPKAARPATRRSADAKTPRRQAAARVASRAAAVQATPPVPGPEQAPARGGRPSKFTPETTAKVVKAIGLGATYQLACDYAGISYELFRQWMRAGEAGEDATFVAFLEAVKAAEGEAALRWLARIEAAARDPKAWQAAAWKLERRYPKDYGRQVQEHTGPDGGPVAHDVHVTVTRRIVRPDEAP